MYHHVNPRGNFINVTPERFEKQMEYLAKRGYKTLNTKELYEILHSGREIDHKTLMITFDDGWLDNYLFAFPILKKYSLKAVIFVVTSWIKERGIRKERIELPSHRECVELVKEGRAGEVMLSWDEIRQMEASGLVDIQSHTHSHRRWKKEMNEVEQKEFLMKDLSISKKTIEDRLGKTCNALCWPWGDNSELSREIALKAGYRMLFTTEKGTNHTAADLLGIKRVVIGNIGVQSLGKKLFIHSRPLISKLYLWIFG
ncbi:MAG: xylanase [Nitrospirae bacterium]|nr:MAG: xylanase [Nitrospirota bacterium]